MEAKKQPIRPIAAIGIALLAATTFILAYAIPACCSLVGVYLYCLILLAHAATPRQSFYLGLSVGMLTSAVELRFFYTIFGPGALVLWLILAFWIAFFVVLANLCFARLKPLWAALLIPFLWTGLEYFRSELYYLRFAWVNVGFAFSQNFQWLPVGLVGVYGIGFLVALAASLLGLLPPTRRRIAGLALLAFLAVLTNIPSRPAGHAGNLKIAGVQMEFETDDQIITNLNQLAAKYPDTPLFVLSEYTFDDRPPKMVREWCRIHQRYLIVGGKAPAPAGSFYNTAFVIDPTGEIVFQQAKSVPIQFFKDGLPAPGQKLWDSPWGKIGICICYDLSYSRVVDRLVRLGAQAIIVPTMDVVDWGQHQHRLHARIAPFRAAEYGIPIFRLASSGISQCVDRHGGVIATAPFPGQDAEISGRLDLQQPGHLPLDRYLAPVTVGVTGITVFGFLVGGCRRKRKLVSDV